MESEWEPLVKRQHVDEEKSVNYINKLPDLAIEIILRELSVTERLRIERVDRFWSGKVWELGWKGQKELSYDVVFEGAERVNFEVFTNKNLEHFDNKWLAPLFERIGKNLIELDLYSFSAKNVLVPNSEICAELYLLPKLFKIDITDFDLSAAVPFLPPTLCEIHFSKGFEEATFSALAVKCPHLKAIVIGYDDDQQHITVSCINEFLANYPHLKKLHLGCSFLAGNGKLTSLGELKELEEFRLFRYASVAFDDRTFDVMTENCKNLKRLGNYIDGEIISISEDAFCGLEKLSNLEELVLLHHQPNVTDSVVKAVSKCRNLKKLYISYCEKVTDDSIICLVKHCKSLVVLSVFRCPLVTEKSLEAVVAEVNRRHGEPPKTLPEGSSDDGIFHFYCGYTKINREKALNLAADNPWLTVEFPEAESSDEEEEELNHEEEEEVSSGTDEDSLDEEELSSVEESEEEEEQ